MKTPKGSGRGGGDLKLGAMKETESGSRERRLDPRVELTLPGRYMLQDGREYPCWVKDISPTGVAMQGLKRGDIGHRIVAYIDQIGRIEGVVARHFDRHFAVKLSATELKRTKIAQKIAWIRANQMSGVADNRLRERVSCSKWKTTLRTPDGREHFAAVIDVATPGAALSVDAAPPVGSAVMVGDTSAHVVRHFDGGIAVVFDNHLKAEILIEAGIQEVRLVPILEV
jgi:hypothetical protein